METKENKKSTILRKFSDTVFSIKNDGERKVIGLLGVKIRLKRRDYIIQKQTEYINSLAKQVGEIQREIIVKRRFEAIDDEIKNVHTLSNGIKDELKNVKDSSNSIKSELENVKDSSNYIKSELENVKDSSNFIKSELENVKDSSNYMKKEIKEEIENIKKVSDVSFSDINNKLGDFKSAFGVDIEKLSADLEILKKEEETRSQQIQNEIENIKNFETDTKESIDELKAQVEADKESIYNKIKEQIETLRIENKKANERVDKFVRNAFRVTTPLPNLRYFEVHLTEHCNLNCQSCTHFSPLAEPEFTDIKSFERDFKRMSELTGGNVNVISLLGGEPLLHPKCTDFLYIARKYFPKTKLQLVTNGLLVLSQEQKFWDGMRENNIILRPTKYPINVEWDKINEVAKKNNVVVEYYNDTKIVKTSFKLPFVPTGVIDPNVSFLNCWIANYCMFLSNGKLYTCTEPANIKHFNKFFGTNIPESEEDGIDIYKAKNIQEILEFLAKPIPFCAYCNACKMKYNMEWKQSEKKIEEWI